LAAVRFPLLRHWKHGLSQWKNRLGRDSYQDLLIQESLATFKSCDLINVANRFDEVELVRRGFPTGKIAVLPYGLHQKRRSQLLGKAQGSLAEPVVVFIGTFDSRKGGGDMPAIFRELTKRVPKIRFLLLGTKGLLQTEQEVLSCFPGGLRSRIQVVPTYKTEDLPILLKDCVLGVFPSYVEGFGFGVLEMMTAGLPVFAYRSPGPPEMLPEKYLVEPGQTAEMASRMAALLGSPEDYQKAREDLIQRSARFNWKDIAAGTITRYEEGLRKLRAL
jgi:glycosyltransferase involved in cell wall biosynthesis